MTWYYQGKEFAEDDVGKNVGFVYLITELSTGRLYVGQKVFYNKTVKKPLKGRVNKRRGKKPSDWMDYFGSNDELRLAVETNGTQNYRREILHLCSGKAMMNYLESKEIFVRDAIILPNYFNSWVSARVNANQLKGTLIDKTD